MNKVSLRASGRRKAATPDSIYDRVMNAILSHELPPGTQLVEERLATVFSVSRTQVRQALARLAHDGIVTVYPNRGAFVTRPTVEQAHEVFEARRLIEPAIAAKLARKASAAQVRRLRDHVAAEERARQAGDGGGLVRLTGEFHLALAEMAGNGVLMRTMREIETLTSLVIATFDSPRAESCPEHEHAALVDAIEARDSAQASELMRRHLDHVEAGLHLAARARVTVDLAAVLS
jgi:DNA-binding GntR family transcriptional regulator